ncbi:MAG: hypothetical protein U9O94_01855 [Nanoarchaeota archaeon]|nr:hypothetical protein [Nanoarchaeota archaeon]
MEKRHKRNILKNRLLQNLDGLLEFPHMLSSTPISEYGALSKVLKHIILFRGKSLISNFADLANISKPNIEKHLEKIKDIERNLQTRLRAVKSECNL